MKGMNEEDYYVSYDYDVNNSGEFKSETFILPNPDAVDSRYISDPLPNVELPDDSLADSDLRDHDLIDNLMYVYYGPNNQIRNNYGPEIVIMGTGVSCFLQLLTIFYVILKKNGNGKREINTIFLHFMSCFCSSNFLFMLGIYATKNVIRCQIVAVMLHYLHLLTAFWIFLFCYYIYKWVSCNSFPEMKYLFIAAYGVPTILTLATVIITPRSYEIKKFCFVSVRKGMILSYMLPVSVFMVLTTIFSLNGIRRLNLELTKLELASSEEFLNTLRGDFDKMECKKRETDLNSAIIYNKECKSFFKIICLVQTVFDIAWFVVVLALENVNYSTVMPIAFSVTSSILNWYIFVKRKLFFPLIPFDECANAEIVFDKLGNTAENSMTANISRRSSSDNIPSFANSENGVEMREVGHECISTISG